MKKNTLKTLMVAGLVGVAGVGLMTGCEKKEEEPKGSGTAYLEVLGLDTTWMKDDIISIKGASIRYFDSKDDTLPEECDLKVDMIENFSSKLEGTHKMIISYKDASLEVGYQIFNEENVKTIYNNAMQEVVNASVLRIDSDMESESAMKQGGVVYYKFGESYKVQEWYAEESGKWYQYRQDNEDEPTKEEITDEHDKYDHINNGFKKLILGVVGLPETYYGLVDMVGEIKTNVDIVNNKTILEFNILAMNASVTMEIKDGKIIKIVLPDDDHFHNVEFYYTVSDVEMPDIPSVS